MDLWDSHIQTNKRRQVGEQNQIHHGKDMTVLNYLMNLESLPYQKRAFPRLPNKLGEPTLSETRLYPSVCLLLYSYWVPHFKLYNFRTSFFNLMNELLISKSCVSYISISFIAQKNYGMILYSLRRGTLHQKKNKLGLTFILPSEAIPSCSILMFDSPLQPPPLPCKYRKYKGVIIITYDIKICSQLHIAPIFVVRITLLQIR